MNRAVKTTGIALLAVAAAAGIAAWVVRDQISRHRRDLFSPRPLRRLAALGHMAQAEPSIDNITVLRDFIAREPRPMLRKRAKALVRRMEADAQA